MTGVEDVGKRLEMTKIETSRNFLGFAPVVNELILMLLCEIALSYFSTDGAMVCMGKGW